MSASHETNSCRLFNNKSNYAEDVFSEHSDNNTERIKRINSNDSENSKNSNDSNDSNDSDKKISEDDKIPSLKHYKTKKTTLDVKRLQQRRLKKTTINNMNRVRDH
ncbi:hypothetical protein AJ78_08908 [Emergomyces pasteurianus Ep9510]|uniref:Uncharacterized protein n=1 Tax=Emergomyces pasteurianus Ep9510 TaxID=1447872 RepID=A0A1J9NZ02_9EURO|nr:hypothetical protein AJ78_08908 [Emergomyces pasteurianus Ep9510]